MSGEADPFDVSLDADLKADRRALKQCLMVAFGGAAGVANLLKEDFNALQPGNQLRIKIEALLIDLFKTDDDDDETFDPDEYAAMERQLKLAASTES